ncbi:cytochrome P450 2G1-like isoform X3 [Erpetoichthys calabaricus]|uniref:Cytochrome P450 2G1-like n=1 Tax=Erpetoichthys calabaricus TaxID=27687 RepID=A0A8C4X2L7_ERPCA|nr:cytochrome P450 2G1-like isoform X1 [Erpetoichthys calabaricus]XP_051774682.1 cytochrome P450 2G1-like isoform X2 [Erpetoichthys calabaricus]XP_051774688.1 cytochrome P450 2G1-like isoform X3 [Erpetoichthys calabaricus]
MLLVLLFKLHRSYSFLLTVNMELVGTLALTVIILALLIVFFRKDSARYSKMPPGPTALPLIGNLLQVNGKVPHESFLKMSETYGPVMTVHLGPKRVVVLVGFEAVQEALVHNGDAFTGRPEIPLFTLVTDGFGLVVSNGERWRQLRRFSLATLRDFGMGKRSIEEWIQEEAKHLAADFEKHKGSPFDPTYTLTRAVSNVICSIVFGRRFDYDDKQFIHLLTLVKTLVPQLSVPMAQLYNIFPRLFSMLPGPHRTIYENTQELMVFISMMVDHHKETLNTNSPRDFIDSFLIKMEQERNNPATEFNSKNLMTTLQNLFVAGIDSTTATLSFGLIIFIKYPKIQEKVHMEIDDVIGQERPPRMEDRKKMPYTDAVIHEIQRFLDIIPLNVPHATTKDTVFRGYTIPQGTPVLALLHSVLFDKSQWETPYTFNPRHFLDEKDGFKMNPAFMPFSTGKRICVGEALARMELFLFFTTLLQKFTFWSNDDPKNIDLTPSASSFANVPRIYKILFIPRQ